MTNFTPVSAALGGLLIGSAAAALVLLAGRVAGISGIVGGLLRAQPGERAWRWAFLAGLLMAPVAYVFFDPVPLTRIAAHPSTLVAAGLLVGFGTRMGGGCTSGHGVCGLARLSRRSLVATIVFMAAAIVTVFVVRHIVPAGVATW
jgi:uncharacterized membrane protein YedE/YeeE